MLGQRIAAMRRHLGMSQADLAKRMNISPSAIGMYEQGRREPSLHALMEIAGVFGVTADYLLSGRPVTDRDAEMLKATLFTEDQRAQSRQLCRNNGFSKDELAVLFAAMLTEP